MKIIQNKSVVFKGVQLNDENKNPLDTLKLFKIVLENSSYDAAGSIMKAIKIEANLKAEDGNITLDDVDYEFLKKWSLAYAPLHQKGLMFADFYKQLE